jgi:hypothetical protein
MDFFAHTLSVADLWEDASAFCLIIGMITGASGSAARTYLNSPRLPFWVSG